MTPTRRRTARPTAHLPARPARVGRTLAGGLGLVVLGLLAAGLLAACAAGSEGTAGSNGAASPATAPAQGAGQTPAGVPTTDGGTSATAPTTSSAAASGSATTATGTGAGTSTGSLRPSRCDADQLVGTLTTGDGGGAGSSYPYVVLENTGTSACELQGWPGVSLVGGGDGTQIGAAATADRSSPHASVTLPPKGRAHVPLKVAQATSYPAGTCRPKKADGLRVYVPGETHSIFVRASGLTGCDSSKVTLLQTQAVQPGAR